MSDSDREQIDEVDDSQFEQNAYQAFMAYDRDGSGYIGSNDLKHVLEDLGEKIQEKHLFKMISEADPENSGKIMYGQFKTLVLEKRKEERGSSDEELLDAFVAMGGQPDGEGSIDADKLITTIKAEFEMTIDIEKLIEEIDEDGSGQIEFDEFKALL
mmetsp:Transcript_31090/g.42233  ORF Transcript_31090/g.42233 Transcript_31090/m.42233 type:complete len:157 (+) Transcript_31090:18-488(+)